jgi:hypothetical protein
MANEFALDAPALIWFVGGNPRLPLVAVVEDDWQLFFLEP